MMSSPTGPRPRVCAALLVVCLMATAVDASVASAETNEPREIARIQAEEADTAIVNTRTRRLYLIDSQTSTSTVSAFDLTNPRKPRPLGSIRYPGALKADGPHFIDEQRGRLYLPIVQNGTFAFLGLAVLDERAFRAGNEQAFRTIPAPPHYRILQLVGLRVEPRTGKLLMLFDNIIQEQEKWVNDAALTGFFTAAYLTFLAQWDGATGAEDWLYPGVCPSSPFHNTTQRQVEPESNGPWIPPFLSQDGRSIYLVCFNPPDGSEFVRMELDDSGEPTGVSERYPGPSFVRRILIDPASERLHVMVLEGYAVTFDWRIRRVVGTVALSAQPIGAGVGYGIDLLSGRWYALMPDFGPYEPGGLLMVDGRRTPPPQALAFPAFASPHAATAPPRINVFSSRDGATRYVIVRPLQPPPEEQQSIGTDVREPFYRIIEDPVPLSTDPPITELDRTLDIEERLGRTQRTYAGQASGYGWRAIFVNGGLATILDISDGPCSRANREILASYVKGASLTPIIASARAFPVEADGNTKEDLSDLSRCWNDPTGYERLAPPAALAETGPGWGKRSNLISGDQQTVDAAECAGDSADQGADPRINAARAEAVCDQTGEQVRADANYPVLTVGAVGVLRAYSQATLRRVDKLGTVVETVAWAEGISIAGVGSIDLVWSRAYARSNGRKPRPSDPVRTSWEVKMCGVRTADGFQQHGCSDPDAALSALNRAGRGYVLFLRPQPDALLLRGSPGGFLAGIQRDEGDLQIITIENNDTNPAVPGLEIQIRYDQPDGNVRHVFQFAGVQAVASYGISLLPVAGPPPVGGGPDELPPNVVPLIPRPGAERPPVNPPGIGDDITRVIKKGLDLFLRSALDALLAAGIWSVFATPLYLVIRRRRLRFAR